MGIIIDKAEQLKAEASRKVSNIFEVYGDVITSRDEAKRLVQQFGKFSSEAIAELTVELESVINREIMQTGEEILNEYQEKLAKIDEESTDKQLDFDTVDLIKGALANMKNNVQSWSSDDFATETVEDVGEVTYEEKVYYEKTGEEEEQIADGTEQIKVGTKKVKVGSHQEKVGTKKVRNPKKRWWKFFTPKFIEEDVYETVDDYKNEDEYKTVIKYKTVMRMSLRNAGNRLKSFL